MKPSPLLRISSLMNLLLSLAAAFTLASASLRAQIARTSTPPSPEAGDTVVNLDAFNVVAQQDTGYQAANSLTATKLAAEIKNMPLTVDDYTQAFMHDIDAVEISDVLAYNNTVDAYRTGYQDDVTYTIRGFSGALNVQLRNGIRQSGLLDVAGLERLEVVEGPNSVINGQTSPGGLFNAVMKQPLDNFALSLEGTVGSFGFSREVLDVTGPIPELEGQGVTVDYRLVVAQTENGDWRQLASMKKRYAYPIFTFTDHKTGTQITIDTQFQESRGNPARSLDWVQPTGTNYRIPVPGLPWNFSEESNETFDYFRNSNIVLEGKQQLGTHWLFRQDYQYQERYRDLAYYSAATITWPNTLPRALGRQVQANYNQNWYSQLYGDYDFGPFHWKTLLEYDHIRGPFWTAVYQPTASEASWLINNPATWNRNPGVAKTLTQYDYAHEDFPAEAYSDINTLSYKNRLYLSASVRYDDVGMNEMQNKGSTTTFPEGQGVVTYPVFPNQYALSPTYGILYRLTPSAALYANYSKAFVSNSSSGAPRGVDGLPTALLPTLGAGYETGIKSDFLGGRISASTDLFWVNETNVPVTFILPDPQNPGSNFNATAQTGLDRSDGFEVNVNAAITERLQLLTGYSYDSAHIVSDATNPALQGLRMMNVPRDKATAFLRYNLPRFSSNQFYVTYGYIYNSNMQGSADTVRTIIPSYSVSSVGIGWTTKINGHEVGLKFYATNIFDKEYWYAVVNAAPGAPDAWKATATIRY